MPDFNHSYDYINLLISTLAIILIYIIVLSLKEFVAEVTSNAQNDSLTSLFSRKYINDVMPIILGEMRRHGRLMSIMFLDCDNFKGMNDNFGHAAGDKVLRIIAESILDTIRVGDIPVRLGGDEFIVFFFETSGLQLKAVIDRCVSKLDEEMKNRGWPVTFSVGVVEFHILPENIDDAIAYVDHVMYRAKREGKNRVIYEQNTTLL
ncbi:MAG: GGDEF domain-containing protein [Rhodospirillaceae bacterium]